MRCLIAVLAAAGLAGCSAEPKPVEAYMVIPAADDATGWAIVDRLKQELPEADRRRIGVPSVLSEKSSTMLVPFVGSCEDDRALVSRVSAIAARGGVSDARCNATIPD